MRWLAPTLCGQPRPGRWAPRSPDRSAVLSAAVAFTFVSLCLTACETRSYERTTDGATVYLDELSETAKAEARQKIMQTLVRGAGPYDVGLGDEIEIFFQIDRKATLRQYVIAPSDKLRIEFLGDADSTQTVLVRPDGRISLPLIGPVMAAGQTASALAAQLQQRYGRILTEPKISVNVTEAHSPLDELFNVLGASTKGRSIIAKVLPDGTMALPLLPPLKARGRTFKDLEGEIHEAYSGKGLDVVVTLVPRSLRSNSTLIIGEVGKGGRIELDRPLTVTMAVARAGGVSSTGAADSVRLFYIGSDGAPRVRSINLNDVMDDFRLEDDMIVPGNSIIYVPPTEIAKAGRLMNAVVRDIMRFQGFSIGTGISIQ